MPDTGAPWNIPYVASTDLVSDWPADSLALANAIDAGLDAAGNAGIGSNVANAYTTNNFSTTSGSFVTITGMTVTITPTAATSKVLLIGYIGHLRATGTDRDFSFSGNTSSFEFTFIDTTTEAGGFTYVLLDSPATTSAVTYNLTCRVGSGTLNINSSGITAIEVAG